MFASSAARDPRLLIKRIVPSKVLDRALLSVPALYRTRLVNYETNLDRSKVRVLADRLREVSPLEGDVIECGSSRGGSAAIMAFTLCELGRDKMVFACDSFEGFDRQELTAEREAGLTRVSSEAFTSTSLAYVNRKFAVLGVGDVITPIPGYFRDTLPSLDRRFCFAFIDCDLRNSLSYCANQLWPRLTPGGQMVFDDYQASGWSGAALGVGDFLSEQSETIAAHGEEAGMYWAVKRA
jgi:hypothetical protein